MELNENMNTMLPITNNYHPDLISPNNSTLKECNHPLDRYIHSTENNFRNLKSNKFNDIESKMEKMSSLASIFNSLNLEQNSQMILNLIKSTSNSDAHIEQSTRDMYLKILIEMIYEEWHELYEWAQINHRNLNKQLTISNYSYDNNNTQCPNSTKLLCFKKNEEKLAEILQIRLNARATTVEAFNQLISNGASNNIKRIKIINCLTKLNDFNKSVLVKVASKKDNDQVKPSKCGDILELNELSKLKLVINDLLKRSYDEELAKIQIDIGVVHAICELIELVWNYLYFLLNDLNKFANIWSILHKITLDAFMLVKNLNKIEIVSTRFYSIMAIYNCLRRCLFIKSLPQTSSTNDDDHLINVQTFMLKSIFTNKKILIKQKLEHFNFLDLLVKCLNVYSNQATYNDTQCSILKSTLTCVITICSNSMENKAKCSKKNELLHNLLKLISHKNISDKIVELATALLRSLASYFSMNNKLRDYLRSCGLYVTLLNDSLASSNLRIVGNACSILWSLSSVKHKLDEDLMWNLGAECKLKALTNSTNHLISMASMATLKNLYISQRNNNNSNFILEKSRQNSFITECSTPISSNDIILSSSSSLSSSSFSTSIYSNSSLILSSRNRKQALEDSNEFMKKMAIDIIPNSGSFSVSSIDSASDISFTSSSTSASLTLSSSSTSISSSSSSCSSSSSSSSSSSFSSPNNCSKKKNSPKRNTHSYYINEILPSSNYLEEDDSFTESECEYSLETSESDGVDCFIKPIEILLSNAAAFANKKSNMKTASNLDENNNSKAGVVKKHVTFRDDPIFEQDEEEEVEHEIEIDASQLNKSPSEIISPVISIDFNFTPVFYSKFYSNFLNRNFKSTEPKEPRSTSPTLDANYRFIKSTSSLLKEVPQDSSSSLISILEPTKELISKIDANLSQNIIENEKSFNKSNIPQAKNSTVQLKITTNKNKLTTWSSLSSNKNMKSPITVPETTKTKPRLVGLVRPIIPARTTSLQHDRRNDNKLNEEGTIKNFRTIKTSTSRLQSSQLIKRNNFIVQDQAKKNMTINLKSFVNKPNKMNVKI